MKNLKNEDDFWNLIARLLIKAIIIGTISYIIMMIIIK